MPGRPCRLAGFAGGLAARGGVRGPLDHGNARRAFYRSWAEFVLRCLRLKNIVALRHCDAMMLTYISGRG
jgi:hypothetical protein